MKKVWIFEDFNGFKALFEAKSFESHGRESMGVSMSENEIILKELETELKGNAVRFVSLHMLPYAAKVVTSLIMSLITGVPM